MRTPPVPWGTARNKETTTLMTHRGFQEKSRDRSTSPTWQRIPAQEEKNKHSTSSTAGKAPTMDGFPERLYKVHNSPTHEKKLPTFSNLSQRRGGGRSGGGGGRGWKAKETEPTPCSDEEPWIVLLGRRRVNTQPQKRDPQPSQDTTDGSIARPEPKTELITVTKQADTRRHNRKKIGPNPPLKQPSRPTYN